MTRIKNLLQIILVSIVVISLSMCKSTQTIGKEYKSEIKNPYKFDSQIDSLMRRDSLNIDYELAATFISLKSNYKKALKVWDSIPNNSGKSNTIDTNFILNKYTVLSAKEYIIKESQNKSLVILNEAHHNNSHRVFAESLLQGLYKNGYKLLFLEGLSNGKYIDTIMNYRKYPINTSGFYSKNPQFGKFLRKAIEIGFTIFPYESNGTPDNTSEKERESDQSNNIKAVLDKYPNEKALIFVGYGHNREGLVPYWDKAMAEQLKDLTGIDPLTIAQDKFSEKSSKALSNPLLVELNLKQPSVLLNNQNEPYKTKTDSSWTDITVFHPFTEYINGRPNWLFYEGKKNVPINLNKITIDFPIMVMAYNKDEEIKNEAVPLDIVEVDNKNESVNLVLSKGNYIVKVVNENGFSQNISLSVN